MMTTVMMMMMMIIIIISWFLNFRLGIQKYPEIFRKFKVSSVCFLSSDSNLNSPKLTPRFKVKQIAPYFTQCSQSIPEAVITAVPAADDVCKQPKHVELSTEM